MLSTALSEAPRGEFDIRKNTKKDSEKEKEEAGAGAGGVGGAAEMVEDERSAEERQRVKEEEAFREQRRVAEFEKAKKADQVSVCVCVARK